MFKIKHKLSWLRTTISWLTVAIVITTGALLYKATTFEPTKVSDASMVVQKPDLPSKVVDDKPLDSKQAHTVPANQPRNLIVDKLGIHANILPVGVTADGAMDAPETAWDVGWYNQSALPGSGGALLMDGHVNNTLGTPGVFYKLTSLKVSDTLQIERGDGQMYTYAVVAVEQKPIEQVDMAKMMRSITPGKEGLNLITCGGDYDHARQTYDDRILVYTERIT